VSPLEFESLIIRLSEALKKELPGQRAHRLMLPNGRELNPTDDNINVLRSSVLMLLFPHNGKINTCLIRRPSTMRYHGGQIAFPGGKFEPSDQSLIQTALRESFEEIGTKSSQIEIIGALTPLYVQVSNFTIHPFIGWCKTMPVFKIDNHEVEEIFIIPVENFTNHGSTQFREVTTSHGTFEAPGFYIDQLFVWGATAMIISEFNDIIKSILS